MDTFGDKLRSEREDRGLSVQAVAETLGVDDDRLLALERNDFVSLPDEPVMLDCLRAYARCLEVDAELMIQDYVEERQKCLTRLADSLADRGDEAAHVTGPSALEDPPRFPRLLAVFVILGTVAMLGAWWMLSGDAPVSTEPTATPLAAAVDSTAARAETPAGIETRPAASESRAGFARIPATAVPAVMSVPEFGVGTGVKNMELVGSGDRFAEGTRVWFWTRVHGGQTGGRIDHVWLRDGVDVARVSLLVGGSSWRTYSAKTLHPGSAGEWTVEARDEADRVLASRAFACIP